MTSGGFFTSEEASQGLTGSIAGVASTKEAAPKPIRVTIDPAVCGQSLPDESILADAAGHLANVIVTVAGVKSGAPAETIVSNEKCAFVPRVSTMRPGGALKMTSKDPMLHTMHAAAPDGRAFFNISIPMPNVTLSRPIDKAGLATLSCSTHTWMRGYLLVTDERSVVTGKDGKFQIDGVPPGTYDLRIWHEALKAPPAKVVVKTGETAAVELTLAR
ncbi:MAG TPA: carboxypeptidase regulatory-like domain-containing protein [Vicinamibacterales bacterium]|nr:carboxypeptidase regulatory-like domain-containing protein [Vicinamibacterales bacterium]